MKSLSISIVVCTLGRKSIVQTIDSIARNTYENKELIIIHQEGKNTHPLPSILTYQKLLPMKVFQMAGRGLSRARNFAITKSNGDIIAFTDDDCIVKQDWVKKIAQTFTNFPNVWGTFGSILPFQPELHAGQVCPVTFTRTISSILTHPCFHTQYLGYGCNMSFRKEAFEAFGGFKEWLGAGSVGLSAEDGEFPNRLLMKKKHIRYDPAIIVYHNRWLTPNENQKQELAYLAGETACYTYIAAQGHVFGLSIIKNDIRDALRLIKNTLLKRGNMVFAFQTLVYLIYGCIIGLWFAIKEALFDTRYTYGKMSST